MSEPVVPPVEDMRFCPWEQAMRPVGHQCIGDGEDPTPCESRREDGTVCGTCPVCLSAMQADPRYPKTHDPRRSRQ